MLPFLQDYLRANKGPLDGRRIADYGERPVFEFESQVWQGVTWKHHLVWIEPEKDVNSDLAILYCTGGDVNELDLAEGEKIANLAGVPVALLHHIPFQPIFDLWEDDLIAQTFVMYLETKDPTWPLLFPMVQTAVSAMTLVEDFTQGTIKRFIPTGVSKRGWTSWLSAAVDPRVAGVVPASIDVLNMGTQMRHQMETWGTFSEQIQSYTTQQLEAAPEQSEAGQRLLQMVDPYYYREKLTMPKIIMTGTNDRYWQVDSASLYFDSLPGPKWMCSCPNHGHNLGNRHAMHCALAALAESLSDRIAMPSPNWEWHGHEATVGGEADEYRLWEAEGVGYDFRDAAWVVKAENKVGGSLPLEHRKGSFARLIEFVYYRQGYSVSLTSPVKVWA